MKTKNIHLMDSLTLGAALKETGIIESRSKLSIFNPEYLKPFHQNEIIEMAEKIKAEPGLEQEIISKVTLLKNLRNRFLGYRKMLDKKDLPAVLKKTFEKNQEQAQTQLDKILKELKSMPIEDQETYKKYLKLIYFLAQTYIDQVAPVKDELAKKKGEIIALTIERSRLGDDEKSQAAVIDEARDDLEGNISENEEKISRTIGNDGFVELKNIDRVNQISDLHEQLTQSKFIETEDVKEELEFVKHALRINKPVMLTGDLGAGKTEALVHVSKLHLIEKGIIKESEYKKENILVFSGSKEASIYDLMGKMKIKRREISVKDRVQLLRDYMKKEGLEDYATVKSKDELELAIKAFDASQTYSDFAMGVMSQAIKIGRPVIIDEVDQIPPEVISRINDLMTKKPGDSYRIQENGEETVKIKEGFIILATANIKSGRYKSREELDAAFASRFLIREHDYLSMKDTYDLILAYFFNNKTASLNENLPFDDFFKLPSLVVAMKEIQNIFQGKLKRDALSSATPGTRMGLEKTVFSVRTLLNSLDYWTKTGMKKISLDTSIGNVLLSPINKKDQLFLTETLIKYGFFKDWDKKRFKKELGLDIDQQVIDTISASLTNPAIYNPETDELMAKLKEIQKSFLTSALAMGYEPARAQQELDKINNKNI